MAPDATRALAGRVAIVTGSSRGIGRAIAIGLALAGARVVATARNAAALDAVVDDIRDRGGEAVTVAADVTVESDVERLARETISRFGRIDVAVNNAGVASGVVGRPVRDLLDVHARAWQTIFAVNCLGAFLVTKAVLPPMLEAGGGRIINITSRQARNPVAGSAAYGASKAALEQFSRTVALEFGRRGIRCNMLSPGGPIDTGIFDENFRPSGVRPLLPPEVIVPAAVWLASDDSGTLNGALVDCRLFNAAVDRPASAPS